MIDPVLNARLVVICLSASIASVSLTAVVVLAALCMCSTMVVASSPSDLNLIPYPKNVKQSSGTYKILPQSRLLVSDSHAARWLADELTRDISAVMGVTVAMKHKASGRSNAWGLTISSGGMEDTRAIADLPEHAESYKLTVEPNGITIAANDEAGLLWGIQTLRQLVRANSKEGQLPCLVITDYPSMKWRGFQDDLTRGQSSKLSLLKSQIDMGSYLKMNFWTYYMEHQYQFLKHPDVFPENGSLTQRELRELVRYARGPGVDVIGCQQSFGHFWNFLKHDKYKHLAETTWLISPAVEESYEFLDDLYSEVAPLLDSKLFNVCCDETVNLGEGPAKAMVEELGVGAVYARHLKRLHAILRDNYGKRMMMWGDIIHGHPDSLKDIPKDTLLLSWGYHPAESFEYAVIPFATAGYEFWVGPGVNCWNRIIPHFEHSVINISNYVRDGLKHGATGMLNTTWDDDGENLYSVNWHGIAWGAECAWNGSATDIRDFNRRVGAVLFGETSGHFGSAIELLGKLHSLPGYDQMMNRRFWSVNFAPSPSDPSWKNEHADALLAIVDPALKHLRAAKKNAKFNCEIIDHHIFVAERARLMATREIDLTKAAQAYHLAESSDTKAASRHIKTAMTLLTRVRDGHVDLRDRYNELWLAENKPYALDWSLAKYNKVIGEYDALIKRVEDGAWTNAVDPE